MKGFRPDKRKQEEQDAGSQFNLRVNLFFSTFIIFCVIIIRLAILQFVEGPELKELETGGQVKISRFSRSGAASSMLPVRRLPTRHPPKHCI